MQYCQTCNRAYHDDSLSYCLDDGSPLSAGSDPEATLVRTEGSVKPPIDHPFTRSSRSSHHWIFYPAILLLALLVGASAGTLLYKFQKSNPSSGSVTQAPPSPVTNESSFPSVPQATRRNDAESVATHDLAGTWNVLNTVEKTSYRSFANLRIGYRLIVSQQGANFTAEGEKVLENGRTLPTGGRTAIHLSGAVEGGLGEISVGRGNGMMFTPVRQEFIVDVPLQDAWQHLARVTHWPSWAKHINYVELVPAMQGFEPPGW